MSQPSPFLAGLKKRGIKLVDVARATSVDKAQVTRWAKKRVPSERVLEVESFTGISRHDLRPDIYGPAPETVREAPELSRSLA